MKRPNDIADYNHQQISKWYIFILNFLLMLDEVETGSYEYV